MIGQAITLGKFLLDVAQAKFPESTDIKEAADLADSAKYAYNVLNTTSVHQSASKAIISPMVAIEDSLINKEWARDLMQVIQVRDVLAVLTHLSMKGSVGMGLRIQDLVGEINPNRSGLMALMGCEAMADKDPRKPATKEEPQFTPGEIKTEIKSKELMEYTPLAVGKVVNASVYNEQGRVINFPLTFRQIPVPMPYTALLNVFKAVGIDETYAGRHLKLKVGAVTTPEFLSGKDIIKERFNIAKNDMSRYYTESMKRETANKQAAIRTGVMSMNSLANTIILSQDTMDQIELEIGRRISNPDGRSKIFHEVKANTIVVCNENRGLFVFYSIASSMEEIYTRNDLKVKSSGADNAMTQEELIRIMAASR